VGKKGRGRGSLLSRDPDVGLDSGTPGAWLELGADA